MAEESRCGLAGCLWLSFSGGHNQALRAVVTAEGSPRGDPLPGSRTWVLAGLTSLQAVALRAQLPAGCWPVVLS